MTDLFSKKKRRWIMSRVKSKNTAPELKVRSLIHGLGFRFRLHRKDLPGCPDLVFPIQKKIIFIHGCFWHGHKCNRGKRIPKTNTEYWIRKKSKNKERDQKIYIELNKLGWRIMTIWECELKDLDLLMDKIIDFLS